MCARVTHYHIAEHFLWAVLDDDEIGTMLRSVLLRYKWMHVRVTKSMHHTELPGRF